MIISNANLRRALKDRAFATTSTVALLAASLAGSHAAFAQEAPQAAQGTGVEEVVVTGTRVVRDGYQAPTPLTVVGVEQVQAQASPNLIDMLTTMPAFAGNYTPQNSTQNVSAGTAGTSSVNLRDLGLTRTLVLINGQRSVGSTITQLTDINTIPEQLIERVDVVTGGASAAYGSDAISGVVNFVLDTKFTGIKGEASGGVTTYGDDRQYKIALTAGANFAGDRGHFLISGEDNYSDGILTGNRAWDNSGWQIINNPAYNATTNSSVPARLLLPQVGPSNATPGGIIVSGPLKGIAFGPGGVPTMFNYGPIVSGSAMQGGDWLYSNLHTAGQSIEPQLALRNLFTRVSYNVTDDIEVYLQSNWYESRDFSHAYPNDNYFGGLTVSTSNPFLPASIAAQAKALGLTTLSMGTSLLDLGPNSIQTEHHMLRNVVGANGKTDALDTTWTWEAYYEKGVSLSSESSLNTLNFTNFGQAINATTNPATGAIVCASTLTNPNNGCVPYNPFGIGVNSQAAMNYVVGIAHRNQRFEQDVESFSVNGNPFTDWAGPVSLAFGAEHRLEEATGVSTALDLQKVFFAGNYRPTIGEYNVTEGFVETVVPLAENTPWAKSLDLNGAVRATSYSTSGYVTTWKVGATYAPIDDIHFRATRSRDIRAPNLSELFNAGSSTNNSIINDATSLAVSDTQITTGNPVLTPETADSTGVGVVLQPTFIPGFSASVDYWNIDLSNAIASISAQQIEDLCFQGAAQYCKAINNGAGLNPTGGSAANVISIEPFNIAQQIVRGIDVEGSYRLPLASVVDSWDGAVSLHALATFYLKNYTNNTLTPPTDTAGQNSGGGPPNWRMTVTGAYTNDPVTFSLTARMVSNGVYDNTLVQCTSGCPVSTVAHPTINYNQIPGAAYWDASFAYKFHVGDNSQMEAFLNIRNIFNKDPVIVTSGPSGIPFDTVITNPSNYDVDGRVFRAGIRFKM